MWSMRRLARRTSLEMLLPARASGRRAIGRTRATARAARRSGRTGFRVRATRVCGTGLRRRGHHCSRVGDKSAVTTHPFPQRALRVSDPPPQYTTPAAAETGIDSLKRFARFQCTRVQSNLYPSISQSSKKKVACPLLGTKRCQWFLSAGLEYDSKNAFLIGRNRKKM